MVTSDIERVQDWIKDGTLKRISPFDLYPRMKIYDAELYASRILQEIGQEKWVGYAARSKLKIFIAAVERATGNHKE